MSGLDRDDKLATSAPLHRFTLEFLPPLVIKNNLPCVLSFCLADGTIDGTVFRIEPGGKVEICTLNLGRDKSVTMEVHRPDSAHKREVILPRVNRHSEQVSIAAAPGSSASGLETQTAFRVQFSVSVRARCGQMRIDALSACWVVNKSGVPLELAAPQVGNARPGFVEDVLSCPDSRGSQLNVPHLLGDTSGYIRARQLIFNLLRWPTCCVIPVWRLYMHCICASPLCCLLLAEWLHAVCREAASESALEDRRNHGGGPAMEAGARGFDWSQERKRAALQRAPRGVGHCR